AITIAAAAPSAPSIASPTATATATATLAPPPLDDGARTSMRGGAAGVLPAPGVVGVVTAGWVGVGTVVTTGCWFEPTPTSSWGSALPPALPGCAGGVGAKRCVHPRPASQISGQACA